ncbi:type II secretion system F family protein [Candidatus Nanohalobium constans]|uniref:Archaeal flagellar protein FlaJ n=1 Tax=Candidatus Nanohalobium constans TaxID=2565781 RepID=A0A5Q0UIP3_9ARCH|nr:type II secretion system F family protein [Candidatus Nanohalobium constans]QGA81000.1 archaeal flagellar protein FlaJ [Candidatus Nanohalobium constans]
MSQLDAIYQLHPKRYRDKIEEESNYASIENQKQAVLSIGSLGVAICSLIIFLIPYSTTIRGVIAALALPIVYFSFPYIAISVAAERRRKEMERVLPDALLLISTNIKSGTSINRAFLASSREEFGPLEDELRTTAIEISGGKSVQEALDNLRKRVNSGLFQDTLKVLSDAIESGGNTAELLESSAEDIRTSLELREEVKSSIRMYTIFIVMAAVFGAPILFSITVYMAETTTQMWSQTDLSGEASSFASGGSTGLSFEQPDVNTDFLVQFSILALTITNFFASLIISQISNGNMKEGAKYIPFTVSISVGLFLAVKTLLGSFL